jgi:uncharacterized protein YegL
MQGQPISELNNGLVAFKDELAADALAMRRVELGIITFGPVATHFTRQIPFSRPGSQRVVTLRWGQPSGKE